MRKIYTFLTLCFVAFGFGQMQGQAVQPVTGISFQQPAAMTGPRVTQGATVRTTACGPDTVQYTTAKATGFAAISINNTTSGQAAGQYFDCPQAISISGFSFIGWSVTLPVTNVTCAIYAAGADSLPTGAPLVSTVFALDSTFGGGDLAVLTRNVGLLAPLTVSAPYVVVVENASANTIALVNNDYNAVPADGLGENLAALNIGGNWLHGLDVNVGGAAFDADWGFSPYVNYDLTSDFALAPNCLPGPNSTATFTNLSSPILNNRMYNQAAFLGLDRLSYTWNFGDASAEVNAIDTTHVYATTGPFTVTLSDTIFGWTSFCADASFQTLSGGPAPSFGSNASGLSVAFTDGTTGSPSSWFWDFGDGNTSTLQSPNHSYASTGTYTVCLTVNDGTCTDSTCSSVSVTGTPPTTGSCGPDTVGYTFAKATGIQALSINNATSASAAGQYFDAPQPITINGFDFVGWSVTLPVTNITCAVYAAGPDSLPTGAPLASTVFALDSTFGGGSLAVLTRNVSFASPLTVTAPYVVVIENNSGNNIALASNDYTATPADGLGENISSLNIAGNWLHGLDVNVGGPSFDADWLFSPYVEYELTANFAASPTCLPGPNSMATFTNLSSPILGNRMYNQAAFLGLDGLSYTWDFGDGSATVNAVDTMHTYATGGPFTVSLNDTIFGWTSFCAADTSMVLSPGPAAAFAAAPTGLLVNFTDQSTGSPNSWVWDFGDGGSSANQNPSYTYSSNGTYTVCLIASNGACSDTTCQSVTVSGTPPVTGVCGPDTVQYTIAKATGFQAISINNTTSGSAAGQYFNCPQPITISGMDLVGWSVTLPVTNVTCAIYTAGPDSLPTGAPLTSTVYALDSTFGGGDLAVLTRSVSFAAPITVSAPYVVVVENASANTIALVDNDYTATPADGLGENLSSINIAGNWLHGQDVNIGGAAFDADWLFYPHVGYEITAAFAGSPSCLPGPNTQVTFTNTSSPILGDRMYNQAAFLGLDGFSYTWDFGDASATVNAVDTFHTYTTAAAYTVTLVDSMFGWTSVCTADTQLSLQPGPAAMFSESSILLLANFTDMTSGSPTSWAWDFGDGNGSTQQNPSHAYAAPGVYTVCLVASNGACTDSICMPVTISCAPPTSAFSFTDTGLVVDFSDQSSSSNSISSYSWDFGDANTSTLQNPQHTYGMPGSYLVCLTVNDSCGTNQFCDTVTVDTLVAIGNGLAYNIELYPNPARDLVNLKIELPSSQDVDMTIYNALGAVVRKSNLESVSTEELKINLADFAEGAYLLELRIGDQRVVERFQVIR